VFRLFRPGRDPGDATGATKWGGRWNSPGRAVLYTASSLSLACLEILVHIRDVNAMPEFVYSSVSILDEWVGKLEPYGALMEDVQMSRRIGDSWLASRRVATDFNISPQEAAKITASAVLQVPSFVIQQEPNYLLDPADENIQALAWSEPQPFRFDPRLLDPTLRDYR